MSEVRRIRSVLTAAMVLLLVGGLSLTASRPAHAAPFSNGDFESGVLDPWLTFTTDNGSIGTPQIVPFDTANVGFESLALQLNVGQVAAMPGELEGGGIEQTASFFAGELSISVDVAVHSPNPLGNAEAGFFELLFDDVVLDMVDLFDIAGLETEFGMLTASMIQVTEGMHTIAIRVRRPFRNSDLPDSQTPLQYIDNVVLSGGAVIPEPGSVLLLAGGLLALGGLKRRQRARAR